jgi:hypothetical protein
MIGGFDERAPVYESEVERCLRIVLTSRRLPARLMAAQAAVRLGFAEHDIPVLVKAGLLEPLGDPQKNAVKYFAAVEIEKRAHNVKWLDRATKLISTYWQGQNRRRGRGAEVAAPATGELAA